MNFNKFSLILTSLIIIAACFFYTVVAKQASYDIWILDGIVVPTAIFIFFSLLAEVFVHENKKFVLISISAFLIIGLNMIPGLKYQFFYGTYDTPAHYRFIQEIAAQGYVPKKEFYSETYGDNPCVHIFWACFSVISGISVNEVFKFIIPLLFGLVPLITYFIANTVLDDATLKYVIIASSFPLIQAYVIYGTHLAFIHYFILIAVLLRHVFTKTSRKEFLLMFLVLSFVLIASHAVSSFFVFLLMIGIVVVLCFLKILKREIGGKLSMFTLTNLFLLFAVLLWAWWETIAAINLNFFAELVKMLASPKIPAIPARFYEIPLLAKLQILIVFNLTNIIIAILSLIGLFFLWKEIKRKNLPSATETFYTNLFAILVAVSILLLIQTVSQFGVFSYERVIAYGIPFCTFFVGIAFAQLYKALKFSSQKVQKLVFSSLLFMIFFPCLIQFFPYQPLVPRANVLSENLPENSYIVDLVLLNTVYQKQMITFAETHSEHGIIIADWVTRTQAYGFSSPNFFSRILYPSPLEQTFNSEYEWNLFLLHTSKGAAFGEKVEYRTEKVIQNLRLNAGNTIYDNGESFIISKSFDKK